MKITGEVTRTAYSCIKPEIEVPDDATDQQIKEALIEKAINTICMNEYDSEYSVDEYKEVE